MTDAAQWKLLYLQRRGAISDGGAIVRTRASVLTGPFSSIVSVYKGHYCAVQFVAGKSGGPFLNGRYMEKRHQRVSDGEYKILHMFIIVCCVHKVGIKD